MSDQTPASGPLRARRGRLPFTNSEPFLGMPRGRPIGAAACIPIEGDCAEENIALTLGIIKSV